MLFYSAIQLSLTDKSVIWVNFFFLIYAQKVPKNQAKQFINLVFVDSFVSMEPLPAFHFFYLCNFCSAKLAKTVCRRDY